jgi:hypothetical protein
MQLLDSLAPKRPDCRDSGLARRDRHQFLAGYLIWQAAVTAALKGGVARVVLPRLRLRGRKRTSGCKRALPLWNGNDKREQK